MKRIATSKSLEIRRPSIEKIARICKECIEHERSWYEFKERIEQTIKEEDRFIKIFDEEYNEKNN